MNAGKSLSVTGKLLHRHNGVTIKNDRLSLSIILSLYYLNICMSYGGCLFSEFLSQMESMWAGIIGIFRVRLQVCGPIILNTNVAARIIRMHHDPHYRDYERT